MPDAALCADAECISYICADVGPTRRPPLGFDLLVLYMRQYALLCFKLHVANTLLDLGRRRDALVTYSPLGDGNIYLSASYISSFTRC